MSKIISLILFAVIHCSTSFAEEPAAWEIDDEYLTPKCFLYEWMSSDNFEEFFNRYGLENKKWDDWWNNIGKYYGKQISVEDSFEASWGKDTLSLTRYLKDCTSPKKNYPVKSYLNDKFLPLDKVIRNKETIKSNVNGVTFDKIEITSLFSQKCGELCTFSSEVIIFRGERYWFVRGSNDRGVDAEFGGDNKILIKNSMSTHSRKYIFDINKKSIIRQK